MRIRKPGAFIALVTAVLLAAAPIAAGDTSDEFVISAPGNAARATLKVESREANHSIVSIALFTGARTLDKTVSLSKNFGENCEITDPADEKVYKIYIRVDQTGWLAEAFFTPDSATGNAAPSATAGGGASGAAAASGGITGATDHWLWYNTDMRNIILPPPYQP